MLMPSHSPLALQCDETFAIKLKRSLALSQAAITCRSLSASLW